MSSKTSIDYLRSMPRRDLQFEIRRFSGDSNFYLWEFIGLGWIYHPVSAGPQTAAHFGVPIGTIIGYHVPDGGGGVSGGAFGDLMNVHAGAPPYPDPFSERQPKVAEFERARGR